jgi:hypothetical protein
MAQVAANGGPVPEDPREDNVLFSEDILMDVPARYRRDLDEGWTVRFLMDRWTAFAFYGYDASEVSS